MPEFRLTQISDTHLARRLTTLTDNFHRVSEHIDATRPDLVVNSGDLAFDAPTHRDDLEFAKTLHAAHRIWIAGFRSCRSVAELLNYQLRLFRPDAVQLVGGSGPEDLDLGAFRAGDAIIVIGFAPYSAASVSSARGAHRSGAALIAIADAVAAPMAEGADHVLLFEAAASPGFFPSLTGAIAIAQSLAAVTFVLGGVGAKRRLEETEARLAAMSQYVAD